MSASIYIETLESTSPAATDMVILHGWAMHGGVMRELAEALTEQFRVHLVDLPGHGSSQVDNRDYSLTQWGEQIYQSVSERLDNDAIWLGWSLGGLLALEVASQYPDKIKKLVLLASNPAFIRKADWLHAVEGSVLDEFSRDLLADIEGTIKRFVSLQLCGSDDSRKIIKQFRKSLFSKPMATSKALVEGLEILQTEDMRTAYQALTVPVLLLGGERDTLVPMSALQELHNLKPGSGLYIVDKAGHAPFISNTCETAGAIKEFCHD